MLTYHRNDGSKIFYDQHGKFVKLVKEFPKIYNYVNLPNQGAKKVVMVSSALMTVVGR